MMTRILFILLLIQQSLYGQDISKENLLKDLKYLNEAVVNGHPVNYGSVKTTNLQLVIEKVKQIEIDSLTPLEYLLWIEKAIYNVGCVHTYIIKNPLSINYSKTSYIPLSTYIKDGNLVISSCIDSSKVGLTITKINGQDVSKIIDTYKEYRGSDGISNAFSKEYFHFASSRLISNFFGNTANYNIITSNGDFVLNGTDKVYQRDENYNEKVYISNNENGFRTVNNFAILKVQSFKKSDRKFFKAVFSELNQKKYKNLIIDLRNNLGGNRKSAIDLTRYLVDSTFSYSILQPKLQTRKYLNTKGKLYFFLSKIKYNIGNVFNSRKSLLGREFVYNYKPKSKDNYDGKIYVITNGFTASSATMVTSWLKQYTNATFIGSQAGGGYNGNNGGSFPLLTLPESGIQIQFPAYRLILDKKSNQAVGIHPNFEIDTKLNYPEIIRQLK